MFQIVKNYGNYFIFDAKTNIAIAMCTKEIDAGTVCAALNAFKCAALNASKLSPLKSKKRRLK